MATTGRTCLPLLVLLAFLLPISTGFTEKVLWRNLEVAQRDRRANTDVQLVSAFSRKENGAAATVEKDVRASRTGDDIGEVNHARAMLWKSCSRSRRKMMDFTSKGFKLLEVQTREH